MLLPVWPFNLPVASCCKWKSRSLWVGDFLFYAGCVLALILDWGLAGISGCYHQTINILKSQWSRGLGWNSLNSLHVQMSDAVPLGGLCSFPPWKVTNLSGLENLFLFAFLNTLLHLRTLHSLGRLWGKIRLSEWLCVLLYPRVVYSFFVLGTVMRNCIECF